VSGKFLISWSYHSGICSISCRVSETRQGNHEERFPGKEAGPGPVPGKSALYGFRSESGEVFAYFMVKFSEHVHSFPEKILHDGPIFLRIVNTVVPENVLDFVAGIWQIVSQTIDDFFLANKAVLEMFNLS
jgi:hypothetical protein